MSNRAHEEYKDGDTRDVSSTAPKLVLRMPIARIPEVYARVNDVLGVRIVYLRTSAGHLAIIEEK